MPVSLTVKVHGAQLVRQGLEDLSREIPRISKRRIFEAMKRAQRKLSTPKARPRYPIQWDSQKQKRAFFASGGFGRGVPSVRSGRSLRWRIEGTATGYRLSDGTDYARYLYGRYDGSGQSSIFEGTYPLFRDVVENEIRELPLDIENHITYKAREKGF